MTDAQYAGALKLPNSVVNVQSPNAFNTPGAALHLQFNGATDSIYGQDTGIEFDGIMTNPDAAARPVGMHIIFYAAPNAAPTVDTDFHGIDLVVKTSGAHVNDHVRLYPFEITAVHDTAARIQDQVAGYLQVQTDAGGTSDSAHNLRILAQLSNGSVITELDGIHIETPNIFDTASIGTLYGIKIDNQREAGVGTAYAIYVGGGLSQFNDGILIFDPPHNVNALQVEQTDNTYATDLVYILNEGQGRGLQVDHRYANGNPALEIISYSAPPLNILVGAGLTPALQVLTSGQLVHKIHAAPADGDLAAGHMAVWFDQTNGAAKFMIKAKQADGTVKTGSLALA